MIYNRKVQNNDDLTTDLHTKWIVLDIVKRAGELDPLLEVNVDRIVLAVIKFPHVNLVHLTIYNRKIFSLDEDSFLIDHHVAIDVDVVELDIGNPDLFVLL